MDKKQYYKRKNGKYIRIREKFTKIRISEPCRNLILYNTYLPCIAHEEPIVSLPLRIDIILLIAGPCLPALFGRKCPVQPVSGTLINPVHAPRRYLFIRDFGDALNLIGRCI